MQKAIVEEVWLRARDACEYCRMPQALYRTRHQIDHIIAECHGGPTISANLCLSCFPCNNHKGTNIAGIDPVTESIVRLFHPRNDRWDEHFEWHGATMVGRSPIGRATIQVLAINHPDYVAVRETLALEGSFPPEE